MIKKALNAFSYLSGHRPMTNDKMPVGLSAFQKKIIFLIFSSFSVIALAEQPVTKPIESVAESCDLSFPGAELNSRHFQNVKAADSFKKQAKILIAMSEHEQAVRNHFTKGQPIDWKEVEETDRKNTRDFKKMIEKEGLFSVSQIGGQGVAAEFSLIQRSRDFAFQRNALDMMRRLFARQDFPGDYLAILEDQLLAKDGKPQIYGTRVKPDGSLYPVIDKDQLDARRASRGLAPLRQAICPMSKAE